MASLELRGLEKRFGGHTVLHPLDLAVEDGEFLVLVGPSGCGKSTVLRLIAGLETPDGGSVLLDGRAVDGFEPRERDVAMVFQNYALYPHKTVEGNIAFPLRMAKRPRAEVRERVREAAALLGIEDLLGRKPDQLSGGQQQRVALARALVRRPSVFLFDEPLSNVDALLRAEMRTELQRLHRRTGTTMVYVTHDQVEAMTLGSRIAVLRDGRLQQAGPPLEVYRRPVNLFVAGFLGSPPMNLLPVAEVSGLPPAPAGAAWCGFRPHEARLGPGGLAFEAELVEELGHEVLLYGRLGGTRVAVAAPRAPAAGTGLHLEPEHLHWFDAGGRRIEA